MKNNELVIKNSALLHRKLNELEEQFSSNHEILRQELGKIVFQPEGISKLNKLDPFSDSYKNEVSRLFQSISGRQYNVLSEGLIQKDIESRIRWRKPYGQPPGVVGQYIMSFAHLIEQLNLPLGSKILEIGCGEGALSEIFARMGYNLTAIDINESSCEITKGVIKGLESETVKHQVICADISKINLEESYDSIVFFESFHHLIEHHEILVKLKKKLSPNGVIVFAAEPIQPLSAKLPYKWGPRLDGESLRAMINFGWMELGFSSQYFFQLLYNLGFVWKRDRLPTSDWSDVIIGHPASLANKYPYRLYYYSRRIKESLNVLREAYINLKRLRG